MTGCTKIEKHDDSRVAEQLNQRAKFLRTHAWILGMNGMVLRLINSHGCEMINEPRDKRENFWAGG